MPFVSFEVQHRIDNMFQQPWPGDGALFRHMSDDEDRNAGPLGEPHELPGHFLYLADAAGSRGYLLRIDRLNRIDNQCRRLDFLHRLQYLLERSLSKNQQMRVLHAEPLPAHLDLARRLFA